MSRKNAEVRASQRAEPPCQPRPSGSTWRTRIVGLEHHYGHELTTHPRNWRTHAAGQQSAMRQALDSLGIADALLIYSSPTHGPCTLLDGHMRSALDPAQRWPCLRLDLSDDEALALLATHDPLGAMAGATQPALDALLAQCTTRQPALAHVLAQVGAMQGLEALHAGAGHWRAAPALGSAQTDGPGGPELAGVRGAESTTHTDVGNAPTLASQWLIVVTCASEEEHTVLLQQFTDEGLSCRALIS